jgi:hypothetical protein
VHCPELEAVLVLALVLGGLLAAEVGGQVVEAWLGLGLVVGLVVGVFEGLVGTQGGAHETAVCFGFVPEWGVLGHALFRGLEICEVVCWGEL